MTFLTDLFTSSPYFLLPPPPHPLGKHRVLFWKKEKGRPGWVSILGMWCGVHEREMKEKWNGIWGRKSCRLLSLLHLCPRIDLTWLTHHCHGLGWVSSSFSRCCPVKFQSLTQHHVKYSCSWGHLNLGIFHVNLCFCLLCRGTYILSFSFFFVRMHKFFFIFNKFFWCIGDL